jgi:WD40 repeat protein
MRPGFAPWQDRKQDVVIQVCEAAKGRSRADLRGHQGEIQAIGFTPDGKWLVSAGADMTFRFWDAVAGRMIREFPIAGHFRSDIGAAGKPTQIRAAVFSADLTRAITSGELDDRLIIWDLSPDRLRRRTIRVTGNRGATLAVSQDGRIFASASAVHLDPEGDDTSIRVWSGADGRELLRLETGGRKVRSLAFAAGGRTLISGMDDTTAVIWDISAADDVLKRPRD